MPRRTSLGLAELDVPVVHDLDAVSPRVAEVQPAAGEDLGAGLLERATGRVLVVDHEPEMAVVVGVPASAPRRAR